LCIKVQSETGVPALRSGKEKEKLTSSFSRQVSDAFREKRNDERLVLEDMQRSMRLVYRHSDQIADRYRPPHSFSFFGFLCIAATHQKNEKVEMANESDV